jgi:hypothetical protein
MNALLLVVSLLATFVPYSAHAGTGTGLGFRGFIGAGPWIGSFTQSTARHKAYVSTLVGPAFTLQMGIDASLFFAEYNAVIQLPHYDETPKSRDASYYSLLGLNAGITLPILPVELYVGIEDGNYGLSGGADPDYDGPTYKAGINLHLVRGSGPIVGLKGEYRRFIGIFDDAGTIPQGIDTRADMYLLAITIGGSSSRK